MIIVLSNTVGFVTGSQLYKNCVNMSSQKGNINRTRGQKHQNNTAFKNNLHDTSKMTKFINKIEVTNVCQKCKAVIEWKIKYKKYKVMKNPKICIKCNKKTVKQSYTVICAPCCTKLEVCAKCGTSNLLRNTVEDPQNLVAEEEEELDEESTGEKKYAYKGFSCLQICVYTKLI